MAKPQMVNTYGTEHRYTNTELIESDRIKQSSSPSRHQHKRILVIDDNSDTAFTLRIGLGNNDKTMQVYSYDNPVNALLDFEPNFYDLQLTDVNMPLMDGFELCQKILQKDINVKVCFMTSGEINMDAMREIHPVKSIGWTLSRTRFQLTILGSKKG